MPTRRCNTAGFTLVELMITMVISGIIAGALYSTYLVQQHSYTNQEAVAEMQQNIRAAMMVMSRDIRMAGYDPKNSAGAGFTFAKHDACAIKEDLNGDGDCNDSRENIGYDLYKLSGISKLGRSTSNTTLTATETPSGSNHWEILSHQPLAENIEKLEFQYLDETGSVTIVPGNIRAVRVSMLARASRPDPKFTNTKVYTPASGTAWDLNGAAAGKAANDHFRRRLLITTIQCRNMGL